MRPIFLRQSGITCPYFPSLCRAAFSTDALPMPPVGNATSKRYASCAVVGSSGALLDSALGLEIDAKAAVFRVNFAPSATDAFPGKEVRKDDWQEKVGSRTTWRVMNMEAFALLKQYPANWLRRHSSMRSAASTLLPVQYAVSCYGPFRGRCTPRRFKQMFPALSNVHILDSSAIETETREAFGSVRQKSPSTGFVAVLTAFNLCESVTLYGFANKNCPHPCYHYFDCRFSESHFLNDTTSSSGFHDFRAQQIVLHRLLEERKIDARKPSCRQA